MDYGEVNSAIGLVYVSIVRVPIISQEMVKWYNWYGLHMYAEGFCYFYHFKIYLRNSFYINAVAAEIEKFRPKYLRLPVREAARWLHYFVTLNKFTVSQRPGISRKSYL